MTTICLPSRTRLFGTWLVLMGLTTFSLVAGEATSADAVRPLGILAVVLVLAASFFKAVQILWTYLNLRQSTLTWKATFAAFLMVICLLILSAYALALVHGG